MCLWTDPSSRSSLGLLFKIDIEQLYLPTQSPIKLSPHFYNTGPYAIKITGQQRVLLDPSQSLKLVELSMQVNISAIKPICSPFLNTSYTGWLAWLHG